MTAPSTYEACLEEERSLELASFDHADALSLGLAVLALARELGTKPVAVLVAAADHPLFAHFEQGTGAVAWDWLGKKSRVAQRFGHSSWAVGLDHRERGLVFQQATGLDPELYRAEGGSLALVVRGQGTVATLTVSGMAGDEDHGLAVLALRRWREGRA